MISPYMDAPMPARQFHALGLRPTPTADILRGLTQMAREIAADKPKKEPRPYSKPRPRDWYLNQMGDRAFTSLDMAYTCNISRNQAQKILFNARRGGQVVQLRQPQGNVLAVYARVKP